MIVSMPDGNNFGWGVAGENLRREIARLSALAGVTLHCIARHDFEPRDPGAWNKVNIGYCFFEHNILAYHALPRASKKWDFIVAGSRWCEHHLRIAGVKRTTTILQGIDPNLFSYQHPRQEDGRFIVFSGGKFEYRKGHDIVIAAMRIFMERHPDVWFSCAWHNQWDASIKTMEKSRLITFTANDLPCEELYSQILLANGIDMSRVLLHPLVDNAWMASIYADSDIGLFPNRCEGGNNLVLCEYMACGRPVVASTLTGHADVIAEDNAFGLTDCKPEVFRMNGVETAVWFEPAVDEVVALLETAYHDRTLMSAKGVVAANRMKRLSWHDAANKFHGIADYLVRNRRRLVQYPADNMLVAAEAYYNAGHYHEAEQQYNDLLQRNPLNAELYNCLGTVLDCQGRTSESMAHYSKAIALKPECNIARYNLANMYRRLGDLDQCSSLLQQVVASEPLFVDAWQNLGACLYELKQYAGSAECYEQVVTLNPERSGAYAALGQVYFKLGKNLLRGIECLAIAIKEQPELVDLYNLKGLLHHELEQYEQAEECYRAALLLDQHNSLVLSNLANTYLSQAMPEKAIMYFNLGLASEPGNAAMIFNRGLARLLTGDFTRGWLDYEARFFKQEPVARQHQELPAWQGEPLTGKTLLVWAEQVYGDTIQFSRYLPLLCQHGGQVVFECLDMNLMPLYSKMSGIGKLVVRGDSCPKADYQIALASLPRVFGTSVDSIPFPNGYLYPDVERLSLWRERMKSLSDDGKLKIGLVWGGRKPRLNANRSLDICLLNPLFELDDIEWFSLQTGDDSKQLTKASKAIVDLSKNISSFSDTAAILHQLDLVITIDTAVAHLAGALGRPAWVLLKYSPDWRWLLDRHDSPWYESVQLFRQPFCGSGWQPVVQEVRVKLISLLAKSEKTAKVSAGG